MLIDDCSIDVLLDDLVQGVGMEHVVVVLDALLAVEAHVGDESLLVALRTLHAVALDERLRQSLSEEAQLIDVSGERVLLMEHVGTCGSLVIPHHIAQVDVVAVNAAERVGVEAMLERAVEINVGHMMGAVHGHGIVVPLSVAVVAGNDELHTVGAVFQFASLESDEEVVAGMGVGGTSGAVAQQCSSSAYIGLEPEHECVIRLLVAAQCFGQQLHALHILLLAPVEVKRHATRQCP